MNKSLLLIGKPYSSKTVYITQFYIRLQKNKSKLSLNGPIENLSFLSLSKTDLTSGKLPDPTPPEKSDAVILPVKYQDQVFQLECPDYGGEQINQIISTRSLDKKWIQAIEKSDNWVVFIRISSVNKSNDLSNATIPKERVEAEKNNIKENNNNGADPTGFQYTISEQTSAIELLQILLEAKKNNAHFKNNKVKLTIALTCWDELQTEETPGNLFNEHFPLLKQFIESNWEENKYSIIGVSALGCDLTKPENSEKYQIDGPENFGYMVDSTGAQSKDITELVFQAL